MEKSPSPVARESFDERLGKLKASLAMVNISDLTFNLLIF